MQVTYPLCLDCIHLDFKNRVNGKPVCKAYPEGVPDEIIKAKSQSNINKDEICSNGYKFERNNKV